MLLFLLRIPAKILLFSQELLSHIIPVTVTVFLQYSCILLSAYIRIQWVFLRAKKCGGCANKIACGYTS